MFILVFIFPVIFPFFRYAYWLFTGNYYRIFSLFVAVVILLIALKGLDNIDSESRVNIKITIITLLLLLLFLYYPYKYAQTIDKNIRNAVAIFLMIYSVLIYLVQFKNIKNIVKIGLLSLIVIELIFFHNLAVNKRPVISGKELLQKVGYNDYTVDAVKYLSLKDKTFFRINKDYSSGRATYQSINDAMAQEFYGTTSYQSFNQLNYIKFLQTLEIINININLERQTRWNRGLVGWPLLHSFASIKYALTKDQIPNLSYFGYYPIASFGDVNVFQNKFSLPLGFTYEKYISWKDYKILPQDQKMLVLYKAVVVDDRVYENIGNLMKLDKRDIPESFSLKEYSQDIEILKKDSFNISKHGQNKITGEISSDKDKMLFFSIPFDKGWNIKVDGKKVNAMMVNIGFIGVPIKKGLHQIELSFTPLYYYTGAVISLISIFLFICLIIFRNLKNRKHS